jgi:hypothetical protein
MAGHGPWGGATGEGCHEGEMGLGAGGGGGFARLQATSWRVDRFAWCSRWSPRGVGVGVRARAEGESVVARCALHSGLRQRGGVLRTLRFLWHG